VRAPLCMGWCSLGPPSRRTRLLSPAPALVVGGRAEFAEDSRHEGRFDLSCGNAFGLLFAAGGLDEREQHRQMSLRRQVCAERAGALAALDQRLQECEHGPAAAAKLRLRRGCGRGRCHTAAARRPAAPASAAETGSAWCSHRDGGPGDARLRSLGTAEHGWGSGRTLLLLGVAGALLAAFIGIERRGREPLVPPAHGACALWPRTRS
jgi:hypothetical protein